MRISTFFQNKERQHQIEALLNCFTTSTTIPALVIDTKGTKIAESRPQQGKTVFCHLLEQQQECNNLCCDSHRKNLLEAMRWGETSIDRCYLNLYQMSAPLLCGGKIVGGIIARPFLMAVPEEFPDEQLSAFGIRKKKRLETAFANTPVLKEVRVKKAANLLFCFAEEISIPDLDPLRRLRELHHQQARVAEEIHEFKGRDDHSDRRLLSRLSYEKEKELITRVRLGDRPGARKILNEFLGLILLRNPNRIDILKAHILELVVILSRAAVEEGADLEDVLGLRYQSVAELAVLERQEELCLWIVKVLERIIDSIYRTRNVKNFQMLQKALQYIDENCDQTLTLEQVAQKVSLSPFHFSHIIKKELGFTFVDYLTKVRMERAKKLLKETDLGIMQVALESGYCDQSYFTKVFKREVGFTPKAFRKNLRK